MTAERHSVRPRTPEWFALRSRDFTSSALGTLAGVDPFRTVADIWAEKMGLAAPVEENAAMWLGRIAEPAVHAAMLDQHPEYVITYPLDLYVRDAELRFGGTPDATGFDRNRPDELIVFEFKVISRQSYERWWASGSPLAYQLQTLGNAMLTDAHHGILAALVLGFQSVELVVREIDRHPAAEAGIRQAIGAFWAAFDAGHAPPLDYARDGEIIRGLFRPDALVPAPIDLGGDNRLPGLLKRRARHKRYQKAAEEDCRRIDAEIVHKLNGAEAATLPGWKISHTITHRDAYMVAAKDYPTLRISATKEKPL